MDHASLPNREELLHGDGRAILSGLKSAVDHFKQFMDEIGVDPVQLSNPVKYAYQQQQAHLRTAEKNQITLEKCFNRVHELEKNQAIREIRALQEEMAERFFGPSGPTARSLKILKLKHSKLLSEITSSQHQQVQARLAMMIQWSEIAKAQNQVLEACRNKAVKRLTDLVNRTNDPEIIAQVRNQLSKIKGLPSDIAFSEVNPRQSAVANIEAVQIMIQQQVKLIEQIQEGIERRKEQVRALEKLVHEIESRHAPQEGQDPPPDQPQSQPSTTEPEAQEESPPPHSSSRMVAPNRRKSEDE